MKGGEPLRVNIKCSKNSVGMVPWQCLDGTVVDFGFA